MLHDSDVEVRLAAVASLAEVKSDRTAALLREALDDEVPEVRFAAAKLLWSLHDPAGKRTLISVLGGETKASSSILSKQKRDAVRMIHTPRRMLMSALRYGVGFAPVPGIGEGIASMQALLTDAGISDRATAALMLGKDNDPATLEALRAALNDKDWSVRAAAVHSLSLRSDPRLQQDLMRLLDDGSEAVRLRAAAGCLRLSYLRVSGSRRSPDPS
jgi:HEAT repeat protein